MDNNSWENGQDMSSEQNLGHLLYVSPADLVFFVRWNPTQL